MIEQFAGYFGLEDIDLSAYSGRIAPMDVVLGRERTQAAQVVKRADVVALLALLPDLYDRPTQQRNYAARCGHGSTLSPALHALVAARLGEIDMAERYLQATANVGIHIAALDGLWLATIFGIAGLRTLDGELAFEPVLPEAWQAFAFRIQWRDRLIRIRIDRQKEILGATLERGEPLVLGVSGKRLFLETGKSIEFFCAAG